MAIVSVMSVAIFIFTCLYRQSGRYLYRRNNVVADTVFYGVATAFLPLPQSLAVAAIVVGIDVPPNRHIVRHHVVKCLFLIIVNRFPSGAVVAFAESQPSNRSPLVSPHSFSDGPGDQFVRGAVRARDARGKGVCLLQATVLVRHYFKSTPGLSRMFAIVGSTHPIYDYRNVRAPRTEGSLIPKAVVVVPKAIAVRCLNHLRFIEKSLPKTVAR
jgi:hypothetical protein